MPFIASDDALWLDLAAKRYGKTPSEYVGLDCFTCEWKAVCFDEAIAERGARAEAEANNRAAEGKDGKDGPDFEPTGPVSVTGGNFSGKLAGKIGFDHFGNKIDED